MKKILLLLIILFCILIFLNKRDKSVLLPSYLKENTQEISFEIGKTRVPNNWYSETENLSNLDKSYNFRPNKEISYSDVTVSVVVEQFTTEPTLESFFNDSKNSLISEIDPNNLSTSTEIIGEQTFMVLRYSQTENDLTTYTEGYHLVNSNNGITVIVTYNDQSTEVSLANAYMILENLKLNEL